MKIINRIEIEEAEYYNSLQKKREDIEANSLKKRTSKRSKFNTCSERTLYLVKKEISRRGMKRYTGMLIVRVLNRRK